MFKKIPHLFRPFYSGVQKVVVTKTLPSNSGSKTSYIVRDDAESHFPLLGSPANYDLQSMLAAGVNLREVDSMLLGKEEISENEISQINKIIENDSSESSES